MPRFTIRNNRTGQTLQVDGPQAPTPDQIQAIFGRQQQPFDFSAKSKKPSLLKRIASFGGGALDIATSIGAFIPHPAISIPSRLFQATKLASDVSEGELGAAAFRLPFIRPVKLVKALRAAPAVAAAKETARVSSAKAATEVVPTAPSAGPLKSTGPVTAGRFPAAAPGTINTEVGPIASPVAAQAKRAAKGKVNFEETMKLVAIIKQSGKITEPQVLKLYDLERGTEAIVRKLELGGVGPDIANSALLREVRNRARPIRPVPEPVVSQTGKQELAARDTGRLNKQAQSALDRDPLGKAATASTRTNPRSAGDIGIGLNELVVPLGLGTAGAVIGGTQGETTEDRIANAILFGGIGAFSGFALGRGANALARTGAAAGGVASEAPLSFHMNLLQGIKELKTVKGFNNFRYNSMLSRPATIGKATGGAFTGALFTLGDMMAKGQTRQAFAALKYMRQNSLQIYTDALRNPQRLAGIVRGPGGISPELLLQKPSILNLPSRMIRAADAVVIRSLQAVGADDITLSTARNFMLTGEPTSQLGRQAVDLFTKNFIASLIVPFPRVGVQALERGLEFSPLGVIKGFSNLLRQGKGAEQLSRAQSLTRAGLGTASGLVGVGVGATGEVSKPGAFFGSAFAGPAQLTAIIGFIIGEAIRNGTMDARVVDDVLQQLSFEMPQADVNSIERLLSGQQLIPGIVGFAADLSDPFDRLTRGQGFFAAAQRRVPILREGLPIDTRPR